jgi:hypothetical protein
MGQKIIPCLVNSSLNVVATDTESKTNNTNFDNQFLDILVFANLVLLIV